MTAPAPTIGHISDRLMAGDFGPSPSAFLIDRDGVINEHRPGRYVNEWPDFSFLPGTFDAFRALSATRHPIIVVTNQSGVGRGAMSAFALEDIHERMIEAVTDAGGRIDAVIHCPHPPALGCACRKPAPGMFISLATRFGVSLARSVFIGDTITDLEAGATAGCRTILVRTGEGTRTLGSLTGLSAFDEGNSAFQAATHPALPGFSGVARDLSDAVNYLILRGRGLRA
ncbi:MAG: HAD-IIIA family hydrolase [Chloroflexi bacterium]|nr:HAD-IIIA family hydrolase [Chloroflexota bacterium]